MQSHTQTYLSVSWSHWIVAWGLVSLSHNAILPYVLRLCCYQRKWSSGSFTVTYLFPTFLFISRLPSSSPQGRLLALLSRITLASAWTGVWDPTHAGWIQCTCYTVLWPVFPDVRFGYDGNVFHAFLKMSWAFWALSLRHLERSALNKLPCVHDICIKV